MAKAEDIYQCQATNCGCLYDPDRGDYAVKLVAAVYRAER